RPVWTVTASVGASHQFADLDTISVLSETDRAPERATHVDIGIERRWSRVVWKATLFSRVEKDVLQAPVIHPALEVDSAGATGFRGACRGIEIGASRDSASIFSGWMSYTYATSRQTDPTVHESFWSDVDRRHALNAAGFCHLGHQSSVGLVFRAASGVPFPG